MSGGSIRKGSTSCVWVGLRFLVSKISAVVSRWSKLGLPWLTNIKLLWFLKIDYSRLFIDYGHIYVHNCIHMDVYIYKYTCVYIYVCICIYIYILKKKTPATFDRKSTVLIEMNLWDGDGEREREREKLNWNIQQTATRREDRCYLLSLQKVLENLQEIANIPHPRQSMASVGINYKQTTLLKEDYRYLLYLWKVQSQCKSRLALSLWVCRICISRIISICFEMFFSHTNHANISSIYKYHNRKS